MLQPSRRKDICVWMDIIYVAHFIRFQFASMWSHMSKSIPSGQYRMCNDWIRIHQWVNECILWMLSFEIVIVCNQIISTQILTIHNLGQLASSDSELLDFTCLVLLTLSFVIINRYIHSQLSSVTLQHYHVLHDNENRITTSKIVRNICGFHANL